MDSEWVANRRCAQRWVEHRVTAIRRDACAVGELCRAYGRNDLAERYGIWRPDCGQREETLLGRATPLFADSPAKRTFSQHANTVAVLAGRSM